jgi:hypothetical protein
MLGTPGGLIEQIAAVGDYLVALETYRAAVKRWPKDKITLRNRARVLREDVGGLAEPMTGGGMIRSASGGRMRAIRSARAAARTTANA